MRLGLVLETPVLSVRGLGPNGSGTYTWVDDP